jgi:hypothetical protein
MKLRSLLFSALAIAMLFATSCTKDTYEPTISTTAITKHAVDSIEIGGTISDNGGEEITAKGICWSLSPNPTIDGDKTNEGTGDAAFTSVISGLIKDTTYYFRAYATNAVGTSYGEEISFNSALTKEEIFEQMLTWMCGSFSSENHADTTVNQYIVDVRLHVAQIWDDRNVGENIYWVYVEQAYASNLSSPYRQRIYKMMIAPDGQMYDEVYSIPSPATYLHGYNTPDMFDALTEADLTQKAGCDVYFDWNGSYYEGETSGTGCGASIPGISYIQSFSSFHPDHMTSWDLGYNAAGAWVMGPDWPYIFDKLESYTFSAH